MRRRLQIAQLARSSSLLIVALGAAACSSSGASHGGARGVTAMQAAQPDDFTFAVPAGTHYVWTERRTFDAALAGTSIAERDKSAMRWDVVARPSASDATTFDQRIVRVRAAHDGAPVVDGVPTDADVQVLVDSGANVQDVRGLDAAATSIQALASPSMAGRAARLFSAENLRELVVTRHDLFRGDVVFRPAREGSTWIVAPRSPGEPTLRRYTVEALEPCDGATCARLRLAIALDSSAIEGIARGLVERQLASHRGEDSSQGGDGSRWTVSRARYTIDGTALVEPATLLPHGAVLTEKGDARVTGPDGASYEVVVTAHTVDRYDYAAPLDATAER
jgi:hypothetical protein